jgi:hypothetical protein
MGDRFLNFVLVLEGRGKIKVSLGEAGGKGENFLVEGDGSFVLTYLRGKHTKPMQRWEMIGLLLENLAVHLLGLSQTSGFVVFDGDRESISDSFHQWSY